MGMAMRLPDGTILMHAEHAPYDPAKAHAYYERTKKLKGRRPGAGRPVPQQVATKKHTTIADLSPQQKVELRAYAAQKVKEIRKELSDLNKKLKAKMAEAKKPETAADKSKKAREAKKYRETHKQELKTKAKRAAAKTGGSSATKEPASDSVEGLKKQIADAQSRLKTAEAKAKALA
jgi:hypothetical protein